MQPLETSTNLISDYDFAGLVIETVLKGMHLIRSEMRCERPLDVSVPQFRVLAFLRRHSSASLSDVAEHIGLTLPSASRSIDGLVKRELVTREVAPDDRRRIVLNLTENGHKAFEASAMATRKRFTELLSQLTDEERQTVAQAMQTLQSVFKPEVSG